MLFLAGANYTHPRHPSHPLEMLIWKDIYMVPFVHLKIVSSLLLYGQM